MTIEELAEHYSQTGKFEINDEQDFELAYTYRFRLRDHINFYAFNSDSDSAFVSSIIDSLKYEYEGLEKAIDEFIKRGKDNDL